MLLCQSGRTTASPTGIWLLMSGWIVIIQLVSKSFYVSRRMCGWSWFLFFWFGWGRGCSYPDHKLVHISWRNSWTSPRFLQAPLRKNLRQRHTLLFHKESLTNMNGIHSFDFDDRASQVSHSRPSNSRGTSVPSATSRSSVSSRPAKDTDLSIGTRSLLKNMMRASKLSYSQQKYLDEFIASKQS